MSPRLPRGGPEERWPGRHLEVDGQAVFGGQLRVALQTAHDEPRRATCRHSQPCKKRSASRPLIISGRGPGAWSPHSHQRRRAPGVTGVTSKCSRVHHSLPHPLQLGRRAPSPPPSSSSAALPYRTVAKKQLVILPQKTQGARRQRRRGWQGIAVQQDVPQQSATPKRSAGVCVLRLLWATTALEGSCREALGVAAPPGLSASAGGVRGEAGKLQAGTLAGQMPE